MNKLLTGVILLSVVASGARGAITRCGHFEGSKLEADVCLDSVLNRQQIDLSALPIIEPAFIQFDRLGDSTFHMTVNGPCRYDFNSRNDSLDLVRIERPGRFVQLDSMIHFSPAIDTQAFVAHMRSHQAEHYLLRGSVGFSTRSVSRMILAHGDTLSNLTAYVYRFEGAVQLTDYTYQPLDSLASAPVGRTMAFWYAGGATHPAAVWIETHSGSGEYSSIDNELFVFPTTASESIRALSNNAGGTVNGHTDGNATRSRNEVVRPDLSAVDIRTDITEGSISLSVQGAGEPEIILTDLQGRVYFNGRLGSVATTVRGLPPGDYLISTSGPEPSTRKILLR